MSVVSLPQLSKSTKQSVTDFLSSASHCSRKVKSLPKHLCFPFIPHLWLTSFSPCFKAEQMAQVCLKKAIKRALPIVPVVKVSPVTHLGLACATRLLVPFVSVSNPAWAGQRRKGNTTGSPSFTTGVSFWKLGLCPLPSNTDPIQHFKRARGLHHFPSASCYGAVTVP